MNDSKSRAPRQNGGSVTKHLVMELLRHWLDWTDSKTKRLRKYLRKDYENFCEELGRSQKSGLTLDSLGLLERPVSATSSQEKTQITEKTSIDFYRFYFCWLMIVLVYVLTIQMTTLTIQIAKGFPPYFHVLVAGLTFALTIQIIIPITKRFSIYSHGSVLGLILALTIQMVVLPRQNYHAALIYTDISPYKITSDKDGESGGGGGGGDKDKLQAPKGALPKLSDKQFTPPVVVIRNPDPKLAVEPTVVVPPDIKLPQTGSLGDPMAALGPPSNGTGSGGGIGSGSGGGVGEGRGPGVGPGWGGGIGGGAYRVGGGVSAPRATYAPDPEYSEEARKVKHQGVVVLWVVVGPDGHVHDMRVSQSLGLGLDEKAMEAVRKWKFEPARKDGQAVAVQVNIEVNFRLY